jgi:hypothetical protein
MSSRAMICVLGTVMILTGSAGLVWARSVAASAGTARLNTQHNCFDYNFNTGEVSSTCSADYEIPLIYDSAGTRSATFGARAASAGAQCRVVGNNLTGTLISASAFTAIPISSTPVLLTTGTATAPAVGVFFLDCITTVQTTINGVSF